MKKSLSLFSANLLFALTMLLVITLGSAIQRVNLSWGLVATEVFIIGLPTVLFLSKSRVPLATGLRLNPISPATGILCVLLGIAIYFFGVIVEGVMALLTGMQSVPIQSSLLPKTGPEMVVYFLAMAVFAPLGEETLFRGAVQGAYENQKSARFAIIITALMFAFYHFRLSGLPGLLPVALILSYVVWRTRSVYAGMLIHFGNNGASAIQGVYYFTTGKALPFISLWTGLAGLAIAVVLLIVIRQMHPAPVSGATTDRGEPAAIVISKPGLATYWPLILAGALYFTIAGLTLATTLYPKLTPSTNVSFGIPSLQKPVQSEYEIENMGGQPVGAMTCTLSPADSAVQLDCTRTIHAYQYQNGNSYYQDGNHIDQLRASWDARTMGLVTFSLEKRYDDGSIIRSVVQDGRLETADSSGAQQIPIDKNSLLEIEWAWHAALLKANSGQEFAVPFGYMMAWDPDQNKSAPMQKTEIIRVYDDEMIELALGKLLVRKVTLGNFSAWYAKEDATAGLPRPVKFDDGMVIYTLKK